ncbi:Ribonuclease T2 family protein [Rhodobacteraceae bacterium THAF1]|uniref:ribonuclease T2 family protein n=1 Tax=Palleronia sp. THAF1 TaxID=2587842 RepID=UPI000F3DA12C|nr:ribonuclease T2 [Palleronia sp. THAF1]QFU09783.1 Ribonuclease T2 family protein [Palleronia sp. THAF1]VDC17314.1 Ribonuclease T2 family protein [Rhodobacteraceae bacterium THAF1]
MLKRLALLLSLTLPGTAPADTAGEFDYYVLALSWSPTWCALEGDARDAPQCDRALGWVMHGLWPQYDRGYPEYCTLPVRDPSRRETAAMSDIMGDGGSAWYQWKKHGRCAGLEAQDYFALAREAFESVTRPEVLRKLDAPVKVPAKVIEEAFLAENPYLFPDAITITCKNRRIQEARICLSRDDLGPVRCGADVIHDCTQQDALLDPVD